MVVKEKYKQVPSNTVIDGVAVGIGGKVKLQDGNIAKEATPAQYKKLYKLFPNLFEEEKTTKEK